MEGAGQLVSTLGQLVGEEYRLLSSVGGQVSELRDELATVSAILRMQSEADGGAVDHFVREWMKQVRELAYDAEDCVDLYIIRVYYRPSYLGFVIWPKRLLATLFSRHRLAGEIQALRARVVAISERHVRYSVSHEALLSRSASTPLALVSAATYVPNPNRICRASHEFIGISDKAHVLARKVKAFKNEGHRGLHVLSIVGFGGLGKTTLATEVSRQLEAEFQLRAHVSVSRTFNAGSSNDVRTLLKRVLQQIGNTEVHSVTLDVDALTRTLKERLEDKRFLLVIDDVWTISAWDAIRSILPGNYSHDTVLVVTTRIETVAKVCTQSEDHIYHIQPLSLEHSKQLFLNRAFGSKDASCPRDLEDVMDKILGKCAGLPIAIASIAGLLSGYKSPESRDNWDRIYTSIASVMQSNPTADAVRHILTVSYSHLPRHLKGCVLYLSIFPENCIIRKYRLLWGWIGEGLVEERMGFTLLEVAEHYFEELVCRRMIVVADNETITDRNKETCWIHAMMLEVIVSKSIEANFVSIVGSQYAAMSHHRVRRLSVHDGGHNDLFSKKKTLWCGNCASAIEGMNLNYLRSLSMFDLEGHNLLDRFGEFTLLRVLDLENCEGLENEHMRAICRMYLLRFLGLKGTNISVVPPEVGDLQHLQILDVDRTRLWGLPETVTKLTKVECLKFSNKDPRNWDIMWKPTRGLSKMTALREVNNVVIDNVQVADEIGYLGQLQAIDVYVDGSSQHKEEIRQALACSLSKTSSLRSLNVGDITDDDHALDYLIDHFWPPQLLRYLRFSGNIARLPDWVGSLRYLVEIVISRTRLGDDKLLGVLCRAPSLQSVLFDHSFYTGHQLVARTTHNFPALKVMRLHSSDEWPRVLEFEEESMTTLETLEVNFGGTTEKSIVGIKHLTNLKMVQLSGERGNPAMDLVLEQIKDENDRRRPRDSQFSVAVKYS